MKQYISRVSKSYEEFIQSAGRIGPQVANQGFRQTLVLSFTSVI